MTWRLLEKGSTAGQREDAFNVETPLKGAVTDFRAAPFFRFGVEMAVKYRYGEDVLVRRRLTRPSTSPGTSGTPLVQADVTSITYTLRRLYKGKWTTVEDHDAVVLTVANVIYDTLQAWGADTTGYNFQHVIDESSLAPIADYRAIYDVLLDDGFSRQFVKSFSVVDEFDAGEQPGSSTVFVPGAAGTNGADGRGYYATSTTSLAIGTGSKAFTVSSGLAYSAGARVRAASAANTANWMEGVVASYSSTTLTVTVDATSGSGTLADWNINLAGELGYRYRFDVTRAPYSAVGNGTTDNTTAIQAALDAAEAIAGPAIVYFPQGSYAVNTGGIPLRVDGNNITLVGYEATIT